MKWDRVIHGSFTVADLNMSTAILLVDRAPLRWLVAIVLLGTGVKRGPTWPLNVAVGVLA